MSKMHFYGQKFAYIKKNQLFCSAKLKERKTTMEESVFVKYNTEEERMEALRRMVGLRKVFEAHVREIMAKRTDL